MRKLLFWYVPLAAGLCAVVVFAAGFYLAFFGDLGKAVNPPAVTSSVVRTSAVRVLVLGDSVGRGTGDVTALGISGNLDRILASERRPHSASLNLAINGARTPDLLAQLRSAGVQRIVAQSNVIVVSIAGNDLHGDLDTRRTSAPPDPQKFIGPVLDRVKEIVSAIHAANPDARVFLLSVYNPFSASPAGPLLDPWVAHWTAQLIDTFRTDRRVTVIQTADIFTFHDRLSADRFHPSAEGYRIIARRVADAL